MTAVSTIAWRELRAYFTSVSAYIVVILFLLVSGGMFWLDFLGATSTELTMRGFFLNAPLFLAFFAPAVSMALLAEEQRSRTLELLMTLPVTDAEIVLGKFLGAAALLTIVLGATLPYAFSLAMMGPLDWGPVVGGYLGLVLLGGAYVGVGVMVSSWTKDQMVAILVSFFLCFLLNILGTLAPHATGWFARALNYASTSGHFHNISRGIIDLRDVVYYLSITVLSLTAATITLSRRRW